MDRAEEVAKVKFSLPNCPHRFDGWCYQCVREIRSAALEEAEKIAELERDRHKKGERKAVAQYIADEIRRLRGGK